MASHEPRSGTVACNDTEPRRGTDNHYSDNDEPQSGIDQTILENSEPRRGTDMAENSKLSIGNDTSSAMQVMMEFQLKQMEFMKNLSEQFQLSKDKDTHLNETHKRPRDCIEENEPPHKLCKGDQQDNADEECDDLDNLIYTN